MPCFRTDRIGVRLTLTAAVAALPLLIGGCDNQPTQQVSSTARAKLSGEEPAAAPAPGAKSGPNTKGDGTIKGRMGRAGGGGD
jgi:hypothetical protein